MGTEHVMFLLETGNAKKRSWVYVWTISSNLIRLAGRIKFGDPKRPKSSFVQFFFGVDEA